jgi:NADH dehydrogenase
MDAMARSHTRSQSFAMLGGAATMLLVAGLAVQRRLRTDGSGRRRAPRTASPRCKVVVVGAGFGGLQAALRLARRPDIDLTLIDTHNHHLFQPLLYQVATAALSPADIAAPVRGVIPASDRVRVLMAEVTGVDTQAQQVLTEGAAVPYDELVIATGSQPSYFGHKDWAQAAPGLKTLDDALALRRSILEAFEQASVAGSTAERARLLTFVLIGGGPTGVEMAGSIAELARDVLSHDYDMGRTQARVVLIEAGPRVLEAFAPDLSDDAARALGELGVEIRTGTRVTGIEAGLVRLKDESLAAGTVVWTAGTEATPAAEWLGVKPGHGGRVAVGPDLRVPGRSGVSVIGDAALALDAHGKPLPGLAPVAKQQGAYVARAILGRLRGRRAPGPFAYRDYGTLATIGRNKAVAEFGPVHLAGWPAWLMWAVAHIFFLIDFRSRVMVSAQWAFAYVTHQRGSRLIVGRAARRVGAEASPMLRGGQPPVAKPG